MPLFKELIWLGCTCWFKYRLASSRVLGGYIGEANSTCVIGSEVKMGNLGSPTVLKHSSDAYA